jgi:hypothetical protein
MSLNPVASVAFVAIAALSAPAYAQNELGRAPAWPGYPGSILISPQQANFKAPALYRSIENRDSIQNPVGVVQICARDIQALRARKIVSENKPVIAAGFQNYSTRFAGGKIELGAPVASVQLGADYDQIVTLNTGAVQVYETDDDDISATVLRNLSPACRKVIANHLDRRRLVFVAAKAIQAYDYEAVFERVTSAHANLQCNFWRLCYWVKGQGEVTGRLTDKNRASATKTFVTMALVPAEIGDRQSITTADLEQPIPVAPERRLASSARLTWIAPARESSRFTKNAAYDRKIASR